MHLGEIVNPIERSGEVRCYYCGDQPCPIWNQAVQADFVLDCYNSFKRATDKHSLLDLFKTSITKKQSRPLPAPGALFERMFEALPEVDIIVDGSKNLQWAEWNRQNTQFRSVYIFLRRDVRALVASRLRRGHTLSKAISATNSKIKTLLRFERTATGVIPSYSLKYDDLVTEPRRECAALCQFLGIPFSENMLQYYAQAQHVFGGNITSTLESYRYHGKKTQHIEKQYKLSKDYTQSEYYDQQPGFRLDERWKSELPEKSRQLIERRLGHLNRDLGYPDPQ